VLELRRASYDFGKLAEWLGPFDAAHFRGIFERALSLLADYSWLFVAEDNGAIIGTSFGVMTDVWLRPNTRCATEAFIWVDPEHRGKGAGNALFAAVEAWAVEHGADYIEFSSYPHLTPASMQRLCSARGYQEIETNYIRKVPRCQLR
jgi:GNAT superfamily N-acetyltransferase